MKIIVTDLTRFSNKAIVCTAGLDPKKGTCIRPLPYFSYEACKKLKVHPGMVVEGTFTPVPHAVPPHTEDASCDFGALEFLGPCTSDEFEAVLKESLVPTIAEGFDNKIPKGQRVIPRHSPPSCSIITVSLSPDRIEVVDDAYDPEKIKLHIQDIDGSRYLYVPITDLGFHHLAVREARAAGREAKINEFIRSQKIVYLRIGLSRTYARPNSSVEGYWIQANGIYTFPDYRADVRAYP